MRIPLALVLAAASLQGESGAPATRDAAQLGYRDAAQSGAGLRAVVAKDASRARIFSLGKSLGGREIECVALSEGDPDAKPAVLVVAGLNGAHLVGTAVAEAHVAQILERARTDAALAAWLRDHAIYVVPRANPDGAEALFGKPKREHAANARPVDDDRDRRVDEDPPDDVDGDGEIAWMRWPDPKGDYLVDEKDPRIVRRADRAKGERGTHRLEPEGADDDGDGAWNEDGIGGVRLDRNFPHAWKEHDHTVGTSAVSEPETRALADFLLARRNVAAVVVYGLHDNLRKTPKADGGGETAEESGGAGGPPRGRGTRSAPSAIAKDDLQLYERASKLYKEATGLEAEVEEVPADGSFASWTYFQLGLPSYAARIWAPPTEPKADSKKPSSKPAESQASKPGDSSADKKDKKPDEDRSKKERALLEWNDTALQGKGFLPWKPTADARLREKGIEIGGWRPGVLMNPPESELAELARKHTDFLIALAKVSTANLAFAKTELAASGGGLATLRASLRNDGSAPALTAMARRTRAVRPVHMRLAVDGGEIVVGKPQILISDLGPQDPPVEWTWVVKGPKGARVRLEAAADFAAPVVFEGTLP